jgi:hypothetical protein
MPKVGVLGSLVWDEIHGRDPGAPAVEEWGGIAYALAGFDAALGEDWEIVPLIKVGRDLAREAEEFLKSLRHRRADARFLEVPTPNNRVVLRYQSSERRCERMAGGVPSWRWEELGPLVGDLDAIYLNFISGFELCLGTAEALRAGFRGPIYADLHSLFLGMGQDGSRTLQPLPNAAGWFRCFDLAQLNEEEMSQLGPDPLAVASSALAEGVAALIVTLGAKGTVFVARPGFERLGSGAAGRQGGPSEGLTVRTALVAAESVEALDPTGCGDVFGATVFAHLLAGAELEAAVRLGNQAAARNATYRGASGLARHLRGALVSL